MYKRYHGGAKIEWQPDNEIISEETLEYFGLEPNAVVDAETALEIRDEYRKRTTPPVKVGMSDTEIKNDGNDQITLKLNLFERTPEAITANLAVNDDEFEIELDPEDETTETISTTKDAGEMITIQVIGDEIQESDMKKIEVVDA